MILKNKSVYYSENSTELADYIGLAHATLLGYLPSGGDSFGSVHHGYSGKGGRPETELGTVVGGLVAMAGTAA